MGMKNKVTIVLMLSLLLLVLGCRADSGQQLKQQSVKPHVAVNQIGKKPVIVVLIDSLMDKPLQEAMQEGRAPAMRFLLRKGQYFPHVVSSFPTMSVTIDSTLLTGTYADQHHVPGLVWYSDPKKRMIFYGNGIKEALKIDQLQVFMDAIYQLNQVHLNKKTKTLHEDLADKGRESASINAIVFRGNTKHALKVPDIIANSNRVPEQMTVTGPKWLSYAALAQLNPKNSWNTPVWKKFGMNDEFSAKDTAFLISQKKLPDVTITYFPENDNLAHRKGPNQLKGIEKADKALQTVLNAYGSWEEAANSAIWIVMGDSAQSAVYDDRQAATVDLRPHLSHYRIAKLNQPVRNDDQIVIAANERMAYIYAINNNVDLSDVVQSLQHEDKLDIIAMKDGKNNIHITKGKNGGLFSYRPGGKLTDEYGQSWTLSGETNLVDITIHNNRIKYGKYPDVLARLHGAINSHEGRYVVVTVQPGYELVGESSPTHIGGGAHGSLHEKDSLVPLIISGTNTRPKTLRIVDIKDWIMQLVNK
ncbi:alkaline phosphatase family protein [Paenibacillus ottowii]|uniref:Alkaline phosphatase family protein n=1 Tax=Paenibacillus ottowii TaxID=2315729 RepID=A0ABY3B0A5_9BACL|nr:alkaline phosphatase family protein [Paenibacillus ottowii]NEU25824.1 alkaline phosphatase family protein [Paenibacillus polymyxa]TQR97086.1 alkaline phosphatase family protein [Paenibacillus ottowii]